MSPLAHSEPNPSPGLPAHLKELAIAALLLLLCLAAGLVWLLIRAEPPTQWSATRLNSAPVAFSPRLSPDGRSVAFVTLIDGNSHLAVAPSAGGPWTVLTSKDYGSVSNLSWSPDGDFLYFDRFSDAAHGVYSVAATGGRASLVLRNAYAPQHLPDGTLILALPLPSGDFQLSHFRPESDQADPLPAFIDRHTRTPQIRVFPDGKEIIFYGHTGSPASHSGAAGLYIYDLAGRTTRAFPAAPLPALPFPRPLALTHDGKFVVTLSTRDDLIDVVRIPHSGSGTPETLFSFSNLTTPTALDVAPDGSVYLDALDRPPVILRFSAEGGIPDQTAASAMDGLTVLPVGGANFIYPSLTAGRSGLVGGTFGSDARLAVLTTEETTGPLALSSGSTFAFLIGAARDRQIALASLADGHIVRRIPATMPAGVRSLAVSPDGATAYYAAAGEVWTVQVSGSAEPRRTAAGDSVAVDPSGRFLYVKQLAANPIALTRVPLAGGAPESLAVPQLDLSPLAANSVDSKQRLVLETGSLDSFFSRPALWDAASQTLTAIPLAFAGDVRSPGWTPDGRILAVGSTFQSSVWHYRKH